MVAGAAESAALAPASRRLTLYKRCHARVHDPVDAIEVVREDVTAMPELPTKAWERALGRVLGPTEEE
jgi:hypothetical protein